MVVVREFAGMKRFGCRQFNGYRQGNDMRETGMTTIGRFEGQLHVFGVVVVDYIAVEVVNFNKGKQVEGSVFLLVLCIVRDKSTDFNQLMQLRAAEQVNQKKK